MPSVSGKPELGLPILACGQRRRFRRLEASALPPSDFGNIVPAAFAPVREQRKFVSTSQVFAHQYLPRF